jgi:AcrR family transcriptional regulator
MPHEGARREEILGTAATLFASSGFRTSLAEIADASGILPGSLYHHFDSKEAIVVELVHRYHDDLDRVAKEALDTLHEPGPRSLEERIVEFGKAIASCGLEHRAALLLTLYEPPTVLGEELADLARETPTRIRAAMLEILRSGRASGAVRPGVDLALLADRLCQSMLHVGVGVSHLTPGGERVPELRFRVLLHGVAVHSPSNTALDRSAAMRAGRQVIASWEDDVDGGDDRLAHLRSVARSEFGRRGYEATTMRDIAGAAGLSTGTIYRVLGSKDELLESIMRSFESKVTTAWDAVLRAPSSAVEQLDALMWVNINVLDRYGDEFKINLAWLRQSPPSTPSLGFGFSFPRQLRQVKALLAAGRRAGDVRLSGAPADLLGRCVLEAVWGAGAPVGSAGTRAMQVLARDTVLRGAATRA